MGANASSHDFEPDGGHGQPPLKARLADIPESCVALVLSYLEPPEICKLARIDRAFRAASSADFIWDSKLPSNYRYILEDLLGFSAAGMRKRDIFSMLSRPISFDGGTKVCTSTACSSLTLASLSVFLPIQMYIFWVAGCLD